MCRGRQCLGAVKLGRVGTAWCTTRRGSGSESGRWRHVNQVTNEGASVGARSSTHRYLDPRTLDAARAARDGHTADPSSAAGTTADTPPDEAPVWLRDIDEHDQTLALLRTLQGAS